MDHMAGINREQFTNHVQRNGFFIYMSEISALILLNDNKFKFEAKNNIKILNIESSEIKLPAYRGYPEEYINVTAIPAGHCPGSIMFLLKTCRGKTILYTGDFRIKSSDIYKFSQLHTREGDPIVLDSLYVDTTFLHETYLDFPKRSVPVHVLYPMLRDWLNADSNNFVTLKVSARYGAEFIIIELAKLLKMRVGVDWDLFNVYRNLPGMQDYFTPRKSRISVQTPSSNYDSALTEHNLFVKFSAMAWKNYVQDRKIVTREGNSVKVCYATHCSSSEVKEFISYFDPITVVGFPNEFLVGL